MGLWSCAPGGDEEELKLLEVNRRADCVRDHRDSFAAANRGTAALPHGCPRPPGRRREARADCPERRSPRLRGGQ